MSSKEWREKLATMKSIGHLRGGRTRSTAVSGREHPESGMPYQAVTDELGNTVTEHSEPGTGVSCRQDVDIHPATLNAKTGLGL